MLSPEIRVSSNQVDYREIEASQISGNGNFAQIDSRNFPCWAFFSGIFDKLFIRVP